MADNHPEFSASAGGAERNAIIFGATGAVGKPLLANLLSSPYYSSVHSFTRTPFKVQSSHKDNAKLVEHIVDFEKLASADASGNKEEGTIKNIAAEAVYITLGTTRAQAGSAANFVKIDREYVLAAAKAALNEKVNGGQKIIYCSATGANSKSSLLYPQSKGLTEEGLASVGYSDCLLFRPAFLSNAERKDKRIAEQAFGAIMTNVVGRVTNSADIKVTELAKAMLLAGTKGSAGLTTLGAGNPPGPSFPRTNDSKVTIVSNAEARRLAKEA